MNLQLWLNHLYGDLKGLLLTTYHKSIIDKLRDKTETRINSIFMQKKVQKNDSAT